jgi:uncharacterized protein (DUF362 family)
MAQDDKKVSRRDFMKGVFKTSVAAALTLGAGRFFWNRHPTPSKAPPLVVRRFDVPGTGGLLAVARQANVTTLVRRAIQGVGGIDRFIKKGDKVLLKVNCAFARPSWMGATTSPEVTAEMIRLCYQAGASSVRVTDYPINDAESCFAKSGLKKAISDAGGEIFYPSPADFKRVRISTGVIGDWETFYTPLAWCDKLIGIPTAKTHNLCGASLAMKNWYGFIGGSRSRFHQDIHHVVAELGAFITPTLIVLDATRLLMRNGPTGGSSSDVVPGNTVVASTDQVAVDSFGAELLGLDRESVKYIGLAENNKLGTSDYRKLLEKSFGVENAS